MVDNKVTIEIEAPERPDVEVISNEDGTTTIDFDPRAEEPDREQMAQTHSANLAALIDQGEAGTIASDLMAEIESDIASRSEWEKTYEKGLRLLGLDEEEKTEPWPGASGVYHPMMLEALMRFQSQAMSELMPASGPAKTKVVGTITTERERQALRIQRDLNYTLTEVVDDYRDETEKLLLNTGAAGSSFRKWYFDEIKQKPACEFIPAEDLIVPYGAKTLTNAPRITHRMRKTTNEIRKLQASGFYRSDIDIMDSYLSTDDVRKIKDQMTGVENQGYENQLHTVYEVHVDYEIPGFEFDDGVARPFVITIDKESAQVLAIYRNWREGDPSFEKVQSFVHFQYAPGFGFYGNGLIHLMYNTTKAATVAERQLIDAGTLANVPAGLKAEGLRINAPSDPVIPGEFRDVTMPTGQSIRDQLMFIPYKEPSPTLNALKSELVEEGRRVGSSADLQISEMNAQAPVGTTLALIERATKIQSAVHARLHAAMKKELRLVAEIIRDHMPPEYPFEVEDMATRQQDYDDRVDVIPVSDPNATTMAHRIMQMQAVTQLAGQDPESFNRPELYSTFLNVLGVDNIDKILNKPEEVQPRDPVTENMAVLTGQPVKAAQWQEHEAHIQTHMAMVQDPKIQEMVAQSPNAEAMMAAMAAHIQEHIAFQYRREIEDKMGVPLPPPEQPLPPEVEPELSKLTANAAQRVLQANQEEAAQAEAQERAEDPVLQMQLQEVQIKQQDADRKDREAEARIASNERELTLKERQLLLDAALKAEADEAKLRAANTKLAVEIEQKEADRSAAREKMAADIEQKEADRAATHVKTAADIEQKEADRALKQDELDAQVIEAGAEREKDIDVATIKAAADVTRAVVEADARERERKDQIALAREAHQQTQESAKEIKDD